MLNEGFLARLAGEFPSFYARVDEEARAEAAKLRAEAGGDVAKALARARIAGAARLWWPYVKGTIPLLRRDRAAMEGFARLVLTVDHLVGYEAGSMEAARDHVTQVLRDSLDVERLKDLISRREKDEAAAAAKGAGLMATVTAAMAPVSMLRSARRYARWLPPPARVAAGAIIVGALASIPFVAGFSAGHKAEKAARAGSAIDINSNANDIKRR